MPRRKKTQGGDQGAVNPKAATVTPNAEVSEAIREVVSQDSSTSGVQCTEKAEREPDITNTLEAATATPNAKVSEAIGEAVSQNRSTSGVGCTEKAETEPDVTITPEAALVTPNAQVSKAIGEAISPDRSTSGAQSSQKAERQPEVTNGSDSLSGRKGTENEKSVVAEEAAAANDSSGISQPMTDGDISAQKDSEDEPHDRIFLELGYTVLRRAEDLYVELGKIDVQHPSCWMVPDDEMASLEMPAWVRICEGRRTGMHESQQRRIFVNDSMICYLGAESGFDSVRNALSQLTYVKYGEQEVEPFFSEYFCLEKLKKYFS